MKTKNKIKRLEARVSSWESVKGSKVTEKKIKTQGNSTYTKPGSLKK